MAEIFLFIGSFVVLIASGGFLVRSLVTLSRIFHISEYLAAFIFMSAATSLSELFVGISSAARGVPELSLGNIMGANIVNLTLVVGLVSALSGGIRLESKISRENFLAAFFLGVLPIVLGWDGLLSRLDGLLLMFVFGGYMIKIFKEKEYFTKAVNHTPRAPAEFMRSTLGALRNFFFGIVLLIVSSLALVASGEEIAALLGISSLAFGAIVIALGTTLPELAFGLKAFMMRHSAMAAGNSVGSVAFNSGFILGLVSLTSPISIASHAGFGLNAFFLTAALVFFLAFAYSKSMIRQEEGRALLALYLLFAFSHYYLILTK